jgi:hypothetical protein
MEHSVHTIYETGAYLANHPGWNEEDSPWKARQILKMIERNSFLPSTVCEVGCGAGEILNQLSTRLGSEVKFFGYEISPIAFEICKPKSKANLVFRLGDLLSIDQERFDLLLAIDVFEHVDDYLGFLRKLRLRAARTIFHIPLDISVQSVLRTDRIIHARRNGGHLHYFTKETALATLQDTGYSIVDYFYTPNSLDLPNRGLKANLLKIPRRVLFSIHHDFAARLLGGFSLLVLCE